MNIHAGINQWSCVVMAVRLPARRPLSLVLNRGGHRTYECVLKACVCVCVWLSLSAVI